MEIGILGLSQSGKSTLFQIMTGVNSREKFGEQLVKAVAKVPDARFDKLVEKFKPAKVSPASVPFIDVTASGEDAWANIRQNLSSVDGILHIVDCFTIDNVAEMIKRYRKLEDELIFSDLVIIDTRLTKLTKMAQKGLKPEEQLHLNILPKAKELLEAGKPLRELTLTQQELASIKSFSFWTIRPELVVLNIAEGKSGIVQEFIKQSALNVPAIEICCQIELEIASLPKADQKEFLASMNIQTPAFEKIIQTAFSILGRICYFTVGEDEVKAWVIPQNSTAPRAAAAIHKDFERGFIKAEVIGFDEFFAGSKERLEGKEYIVKDGDIISFRFNV